MVCYVIFLLTIFASSAFAQLKVIYPNVNGVGEKLFGYAALRLALEHSGQEFTLEMSKSVVNDARIRQMLEQGQISISDFGTSQEFEQELLPIYFPIDLGISGWRIFLIHQDNQLLFSKIKTINDLRIMIAGQGTGWSDVQILEVAGLEVRTPAHISHLFAMTNAKRFDYFPLGANEAHSLLEMFKSKGPNVIIEKNILLVYPFGRLFFVNKSNTELRDAVELGLQRAFENGKFLKLFKSHESNKAIFSMDNLSSRIKITIDNPNISMAFKAIPKKYFLDLEMIK